MFGDDGEKFGAWPETKKHVYEDGWLVRFFDLLGANQSWIQTTTPAEALDNVPPVGNVYLPEGSYREMTEWVLPADQLAEFVQVRRELEPDARWPKIARFVRGGFWRNFKVKYPETHEMYSRMMQISRRLQSLVASGASNEWIDHARTALYRGQCNCPYWHGAFGGVYLPHLRNAIYQHLIAADNLLDRATGRGKPFVEATADDFNFDGRQEVQLANDRLVALMAPSRGGQIYELDVRSICHNLLATLTRRPEAYHRKVLAGNDGRNDVAGISDRVVFKQADLDQRLQYDASPRKSLLDHFYDPNVSLAAVARGEAAERGDFLNRAYEARVRRNPGRVQVQFVTQGHADGQQIRITKGVTLEAGASTLEIAYLLEGLRPDQPLHFAVELNFAGLPSGADDRFFYGHHRRAAGPAWLTARSDRMPRVGSGRRVAGHRLLAHHVAPRRHLGLSRRNGQPVRRRLRAGASIGGGEAPLDRARRRRRPLEHDDLSDHRHSPGRKPHGKPGGRPEPVTRRAHRPKIGPPRSLRAQFASDNSRPWTSNNLPGRSAFTRPVSAASVSASTSQFQRPVCSM